MDAVKQIQKRLERALERQADDVMMKEAKAGAVSYVLDQLREILGSYSVSRELTFLFRQQLEPDLANVWTLADLEVYSRRLEGFAKRLDDSLRRWQVKYCKEK
jgi:hypothetical protein